MSSVFPAGVILLVWSGAVLAQAARPIEEIIVTAQRVEENASKVPIAINAFDEMGIEDRHIIGIEDLRVFVPNFAFTTTNTVDAVASIRGVGTLSSGGGGEAGVSVHVNEIPQPGGRLQVLEIYDVERLEVLRGPQGTLYGRNATGGVVNVVTRQPGFDGVSGYLDAERGDHDLMRFRGALNVPVNDSLAVRIAGLSIERDGYTKNLAAGQIPGIHRDIDGRDLHSVRASMTWRFSDRTNATMRYEYFKEDDDRQFFQNQICKTSISPANACQPGEFGIEPKNVANWPIGINNGIRGLTTLGARDAETGLVFKYPRPEISNPRHVHLDQEPHFVSENNTWQLDLRHELNWGELSLAASHVNSQGDVVVDNEPAVGPELNAIPEVPDGLYPVSAVPPGIDGLSGEECNVDAGLVGTWGGCIFDTFSRIYGQGDGRNDSKFWSAELKLRTQLEGRFNLLAGAIYQSSRSRSVTLAINNLGDFNSRFGFIGPTGLFFRDPSPSSLFRFYPPLLIASEAESEFDSLSAFGELYVMLDDAVKLTLGVRYNHDEKEIAGRTIGGQSAIDLNTPSFFNGALGDGPVWARFAPFADPMAGSLLTDFYGVTDTFEGYLQLPIVEQYNERLRISGTPTHQTWEGWSGRAALSWQATPDLLVYGSYARGYKPGGFNVGSVNLSGEIPLTHDREDVNAFEIGTKALLWDDSLSISAAAFFNDYKGMQLARPRFDILTGGSGNVNVDAKTYGAELEMRWRPPAAPRAELELGYAYLKTELKDQQPWVDPTWLTGGNPDYIALSDWLVEGDTFIAPIDAVRPLVDAAIAAGVAIGPDEAPAAQDRGIPAWFSRAYLEANGVTTQASIPFDISGNRFPESPEHTVHLAASYLWDLAGGALTARWDYYWQDAIYLEIFNHKAFQIGSWDQHNATLMFESGSGRWSAGAWIKNIENDVHIVGGKRSTINTGFSVTEPRAYGASLRWNFGVL